MESKLQSRLTGMLRRIIDSWTKTENSRKGTEPLNEHRTTSSERELLERLYDAEKHINELRRDNAIVRHEFQSLASKFETALIFFESRVDSIYQAALRHDAGELPAAEIMIEEEVENRLRDLLLGGFANTPAITDINIKDLVSGDLSVGPKRGALTLHGFRLDPRAARDMGDCIRIEAGVFGAVIFGPYKRLKVGKYRVSFELEILADLDQLNGSMSFDIHDSTINEQMCIKTVRAKEFKRAFRAELVFDWSPASVNHVVEIRVFQGLNSPVLLREILIADFES
ncbi:hypothetical protein EPK99_09250 [Neorhizobium lilium]|uniref:Uncharacterized protein n=1 Tax=Neorhizobium lilium TaxID=2503024 RepID=A0A444LIJ7_9HYPH|nr:hypothetical protein [Neorhizobium lilium]RWX78765.1 hypothetical protein EPK99_09250 [Neorhizobium lilium]